MYVSPVLRDNSRTPKEYTNRARDEINRKFNLPASNLKHGSSSLKIVTNASDTSLNKVTSNESVESQNEELKEKKSLFGKLRSMGSSQVSIKEQFNNLTRTTSNSSATSVIPHQDVEMSDGTSLIGDLGINNLQPLQPTPSIASSYSNMSYESANPSIQSKYSLNNSLFSNQGSLTTQYTNVSDYTPYQTPQTVPQKQLILAVQDALPTTFSDMYAPELLADPRLLIDGRPMFTKRDLLDWTLNDIRSLLIVESLKPEWGNQLPLIYPSSNHEFKFEFLPLDADDATIVHVLVESDVYKEAKFDKSFRIQTAKYTLFAARKRHQQILKASGLPHYYNNRFSKPEWRNVIENFMLNLAVEAQCRFDYKKAMHDLKKQIRGGQSSGSSSLNFSSAGKNSLLRKAIMNDVSQNKPQQSTSLTKEEKAELWSTVQRSVYKRLGLDWTPDQVST